MVEMSSMSGTLPNSTSWSVSSAAAMTGSEAFLLPEIADRPFEPSPASDAQEFHLRLPYSTAPADRVD